MDDAVFWILLGVEVANFALMAYIVRWTKRAGKSIIGSIVRRLNLRDGPEPSVMEKARGFFGRRSEGPREIESGEALNLDGIADALGVDPGRLKTLAQSYLGAAPSAGARGPRPQGGAPDDPLAPILAKALSPEGLSKADWPMAVPLLIDFLRGNGQSSPVIDEGARW